MKTSQLVQIAGARLEQETSCDKQQERAEADFRLSLSNDELVILPMIETDQSLENLDAIASVPGVDVMLIGPSDLSIELGAPLD